MIFKSYIITKPASVTWNMTIKSSKLGIYDHVKGLRRLSRRRKQAYFIGCIRITEDDSAGHRWYNDVVVCGICGVHSCGRLYIMD